MATALRPFTVADLQRFFDPAHDPVAPPELPAAGPAPDAAAAGPRDREE